MSGLDDSRLKKNSDSRETPSRWTSKQLHNKVVSHLNTKTKSRLEQKFKKSEDELSGSIFPTAMIALCNLH